MKMYEFLKKNPKMLTLWSILPCSLAQQFLVPGSNFAQGPQQKTNFDRKETASRQAQMLE